ncbi:MAG: metal ABC transporter ATP-binding protein [Gemmatales bacterium]|nr:metal ABC transporter ATP-binding protein [Gemmatales bacterium]MCS7161664.1 metal ABC transporter ATP-binding protein [Gemmatales bacterium]MDW8176867.1 metal ABC transporter ATP-binding protein [Gemmatales bacterium]MDW8222642.1 metal ABC transporter ATP-binding protein [Gemmatales bacterium]
MTDHHTHALVTIRDLCVSLGGKRILHHLNTWIPRGKITALIGLNGSGKTTLLRALLGEIPYQGQIVFHCGHQHQPGQPERIGYVPQRLLFDINLPLTVSELLALGISRRPLFLGIGKSQRQRLVDLLRRVQAEHLAESPVAGLSGGELQRVLLALALEPLPELLLLDEPAAGIDFRYQGEFYNLIARLNQEQNITVLLVSHDLSVVSNSAHHVLCLRNGQILCEGPPREILSGERIGEIFGEDKAVYAHGAHHH